jgi:hypothetical protein
MHLFRSVSLAFMAMLTAIALTCMVSVRAQDKARPGELTGLVVAKVEKTIVEGQNGIEITFDKASAERLRQFTDGSVGRILEFAVDGKKLIQLRLIDPLTDGNVLLTGHIDNTLLISPSATVSVELE